MPAPAKKTARMKVRCYVMDLILKNPGKEVVIPSYNVLGPLLGVAKSSAALELQDLKKAGYIIPRVGVGTVSNPRSSYGPPDTPIVGIVVGDGKHAHQRYREVMLISSIKLELTKQGMVVRDVPLYTYDEKSQLDELRWTNCDAVVWIEPHMRMNSVIQKLNRLMPVLTVMHFVPEVSGVVYDHVELGVRIGEALLRNHIARPVQIAAEMTDNPLWRGICRAYRSSGIELEDELYFGGPDAYEKLRSALRAGIRPDALLLRIADNEKIQALYDEFELTGKCLPVSAMYKPKSLKAPMLLVRQPFETFAGRVADLMQHRIANPDSEIEQEVVPFAVLEESRL